MAKQVSKATAYVQATHDPASQVAHVDARVHANGVTPPVQAALVRYRAVAQHAGTPIQASSIVLRALGAYSDRRQPTINVRKYSIVEAPEIPDPNDSELPAGQSWLVDSEGRFLIDSAGRYLTSEDDN